MRSFLSELAEQLYSKYGRDIAKCTILFPSQRARLYFSQALAEVIPNGVGWSPKYTTIDELMCSVTNLQSADRLRLVAELYGVYSKYHKEDFDDFYHWGEMLIADFDMVDKYMVDAERLFRNVADIKEIEADTSYLTEEQKQYLSRFWKTVNHIGNIGEQKEYFLKIWRSLPNIYAEYKARLRTLGFGYTGMIYRDAAEAIKSATTPLLADKKYVVAGFNALSNCEKVLFSHLKSAYNADFAWDYSDYYYNSEEQEAGRFMRQNVKDFPPTLDISHDDFRVNRPKFQVASTTTSVAQCSYVSQILEQIAAKDNQGKPLPLDRNTAIVLTDENLLVPLLYALPEWAKGVTEDDKEGVNVTMGYPLRSTFAYSFVERLLELQSHSETKDGVDTFYYTDVDGLVSHPYIADRAQGAVSEIRKRIVEQKLYHIPQSMLLNIPHAKELFVAQSSALSLLEYIDKVFTRLLEEEITQDKLNIEYMLRIRTSLHQLRNIVDSCGIELTVKLCISLIRRHLQSVRIPFEGEPLEGLQIMGILETRNLDFKNVIVLSMSESNFPGTKVTDNSYIPYSLRFAYNMPTQEHHQGVYAYYFYRLIERAESVWMLYSSTADEKGSGEPSRYIRQLQYESGLPIEFVKVVTPVNVIRQGSISLEKDSQALEVLSQYTSGKQTLSPTALSAYVQCPLRFYYRYIAKIKVVDSLEEGLDDRGFGNIFHKAAEKLYTGLVEKQNTLHHLLQITDDEVEAAADYGIAKEYFGSETLAGHHLSGEMVIVRKIIIRYLKYNLLAYDVANHNFTVDKLEYAFSHPFTFESAGQSLTVLLEGRADRIDRLDENTLRIIDYKTGEEHLHFSGFDKLFNGTAAQRVSNTINTLMYAMIASTKYECDVQPALYYLRDMHDKNYTPLLMEGKGVGIRPVPIVRYSSIAEEFESQLFNTLGKMFDPAEPFCQAEDENSCTYCDFSTLCNRGKRRTE